MKLIINQKLLKIKITTAGAKSRLLQDKHKFLLGSDDVHAKRHQSQKLHTCTHTQGDT